MSDQPKVTSDPIEPEPVRWRGRVITQGRRKAIGVIALNVLFWLAYAGYPGTGIVLFAMVLLWDWVVFGWQPTSDGWRSSRNSEDSFSLGSMTGVAIGPESAAGRADYLRKGWTDEQGRREQERRMR